MAIPLKASLLSKKGNRKGSVGDAAGVPAVYTVLFEFLSEECPSYQYHLVVNQHFYAKVALVWSEQLVAIYLWQSTLHYLSEVGRILQATKRFPVASG